MSTKQDTFGRFCLNDLHKASGGASKHQTAHFFMQKSTYELITELLESRELESTPPLQIKSGRYGGTFVCKELAYAYAMWISPKFHLKVIRFFDKGVTQCVAVAAPNTIQKRNPCRTGLTN